MKCDQKRTLEGHICTELELSDTLHPLILCGQVC